MQGSLIALRKVFRRPGLDPGLGFFFLAMERTAMKGGWVYIMADHYRGAMYSGVTSFLPARVLAHREGRGSLHVLKRNLHRLVWAEFTSPIEEAIAHEKRIKRWHRPWKFALIEAGNPDWQDLFERMNG